MIGAGASATGDFPVELFAAVSETMDEAKAAHATFKRDRELSKSRTEPDGSAS